MPQAIDISQINSVKQNIHRDLIVSMSGVTSKHLADLEINIIRGVENEDKVVVFDGYAHVATRYEYDKTSRSALGKAVERTLKVTNDICYVPDNVQNYREKAVPSMLGTSSNGATTDIQEKRLRIQAELFGNHVIYNFFHGDKSKPANDFYGLYDGILVKLQKDKEDGYIAANKGNYVVLGAVDTTDPKKCYDAYVKFYQKMDAALQDDSVIYTTPAFFDLIVRGYAETFVGAQNTIINVIDKNTFVSHETQGARLKKVKLLGTGQGFIATAPGNLDYATDLTGDEDPSSAYMSITPDGFDPLNTLLIGMQCASGTRVIDFNAQKLCISDYNFVAPVQKQNDTLTIKETGLNDLAIEVARLRAEVAKLTPDESGDESGDESDESDGD